MANNYHRLLIAILAAIITANILVLSVQEAAVVAEVTDLNDALKVVKVAHIEGSKVNPLENITVTLDIQNDIEVPLYNISFNDLFLNTSFIVKSSKASVENTSIVYHANAKGNYAVNYTWAVLNPEEIVNFWMILQINSTATSVTIPATTLTYQNEYGFSGKKVTTELTLTIEPEEAEIATESSPWPPGTIHLDLLLVPTFYLVPILAVFCSAFVIGRRSHAK